MHCARAGAGEAAAAYSHHGRVRRSTNPAELISDMVNRWWAACESGDDAVLYAYARDAVRVLNGLARRHVEKADRLFGPELVVEEFAPADLAPRTYRVGDELCCLRNRSRLGAGRDPSGKGVRNGTRGTVQAIDCQSREVTLATSDGRSVRLPADYVKRSTDYGYAWTLHKGQGQTVGQAQRNDMGEVARRRGRAFVFARGGPQRRGGARCGESCDGLDGAVRAHRAGRVGEHRRWGRGAGPGVEPQRAAATRARRARDPS